MSDDDIIDSARPEGFELEERICRGQWVHGWRRGDDNAGRASGRAVRRWVGWTIGSRGVPCSRGPPDARAPIGRSVRATVTDRVPAYEMTLPTSRTISRSSKTRAMSPSCLNFKVAKVSRISSSKVTGQLIEECQL